MSKDLVLLHGGQHGSWCWKLLIDALVKSGWTGRALALDVPGCGQKRHRETGSIGIDDIAHELNAEVLESKLKSPVLLGHSQAGILLPRMVTFAPSLYSEVVFLTTAAPKEGQTLARMMGTSFHWQDPHSVGYPLDIATSSREEISRALFGPGVDSSTLEWLLAESSLDNWPEKTGTSPITREGFRGLIPTSYIVALDDPILPAAWQGCFAERVGAERIYAMDTAHEPFASHPDELAELLTNAFL